MYPVPTPADLNPRIEMVSTLLAENTEILRQFHFSDPRSRIHGMKHDGSKVSKISYFINNRTRESYLDRFPKDSFDGEETPMLRPNAEFTLLQDPDDATVHTLEYRESDPTRYSWGTHMMSILFKGVPVAFALGVPLRNERYVGSVLHGVFLNGAPYELPKKNPKLIVGTNEEEHRAVLRPLTGLHDIHIAGLCTWLILQGETLGGINKFPLPYESSCILACARALGATVTNIFGEQYQPYNTHHKGVWSFHPLSHATLLSKN
jgi:fructose-1,6-bisphosphatase/inositol monophosphatase family enzyme